MCFQLQYAGTPLDVNCLSSLHNVGALQSQFDDKDCQKDLKEYTLSCEDLHHQCCKHLNSLLAPYMMLRTLKLLHNMDCKCSRTHTVKI